MMLVAVSWERFVEWVGGVIFLRLRYLHNSAMSHVKFRFICAFLLSVFMDLLGREIGGDAKYDYSGHCRSVRLN